MRLGDVWVFAGRILELNGGGDCTEITDKRVVQPDVNLLHFSDEPRNPPRMNKGALIRLLQEGGGNVSVDVAELNHVDEGMVQQTLNGMEEKLHTQPAAQVRATMRFFTSASSEVDTSIAMCVGKMSLELHPVGLQTGQRRS
ncbi:hypothetical protein APSETT445_001272 [Aspergillus pseudonomiae]